MRIKVFGIEGTFSMRNRAIFHLERYLQMGLSREIAKLATQSQNWGYYLI